MGTVWQRTLKLSPEEASFGRRGFRGGDPPLRERLERSGGSFIEGYNAALADDSPERLAARLESQEPELAGFRFEGAALALALLDLVAPWRRGRLQRFLDGPAAHHVYLVHVGAGWLLARAPVRVSALLRRLDPLLGWLALDGYGFHQGFFHWPEAVVRQRVPRRLRGYARHAFDQGLGRSLWFVDGAEVDRIAGTIAAFPAGRQGDLWSGVGLACAYAGGRERSAIAALCQAAGAHCFDLAQGASFAAKARQRAGNEARHTDLACEVLCGMSAERAAAVTDAVSVDLPADGAVPPFEVWRQRIRHHFARPGGIQDAV